MIGLTLCSLVMSLLALNPNSNHALPDGITVERWGTIDGEPVYRYTLTNDQGLMMKITNYGCIITELHVPDREGRLADIVLGHDSLEDYVAGHPYFGCIAGRYANRIAGGQFEIDDRSYQVARNNGPNHLHGGVKGFDKHVWKAIPMRTPDGPALQLTRVSPDGEEGYPGNLRVTVVYTLTNDNELRTEMAAMTDAPTVCNLAQHTYWNLAGHDSGPVTGHVVHLHADRYTPVDGGLIPTGELAPVAGTPFDFRAPKQIGRDLKAAGGDPAGFDHNFVLNGETEAFKPAARVHDPVSGRVMELHTNQPGLQFYTGNFLDGGNIGKGGAVYEQYHGFCLETQRFPDSINQPDWPTVVLRPGRPYHHLMITRFSVE